MVESKSMDPPKTVYVVSLIITTSGPEYGVVTGAKVMVVDVPLALIVRGLGSILVINAKVDDSSLAEIWTL